MTLRRIFPCHVGARQFAEVGAAFGLRHAAWRARGQVDGEPPGTRTLGPRLKRANEDAATERDEE